MPWHFDGRDDGAGIALEDIVHPDDLAKFRATVGDARDHFAMVVSDPRGKHHANAQVERVAQRIAKTPGKPKGKGAGARTGKGTPGAKQAGTAKDPGGPPKTGTPGGTGDRAKQPAGAGQPGGKAKPGGPAGTGDKPAPGDGGPPAPVKPPDVPDGVELVEGKDGFKVRVTVDGAKQDLPFKDGESDAKLEQRVRDATEKVREEIDPKRSTRIQGTPEGDPKIDPRPGLGGVPVPEGFPVNASGLAPNENAYPATIISHGGDVDTRNDIENTVQGGTTNYTMELDYKAMSQGTADETWNRLQNIAYKWELIDITNLDVESLRTKMKSAGEDPDSGIRRNIGRQLSNTWEDTQADIADVAGKPGAEGYLAVVAIADLVDIGAELISSYFALVTAPLNQRSIGFNRKGTFLLRCFAQPVVDRAKVLESLERGGHPVVRAPSVDTMIVRVSQINERAQEALGADLAGVAQLEKDLKGADEFKRLDAETDLPEARAGLEDDNLQAVERYERHIERELGRIGEWRKADDAKVPLDSRDSKLWYWHAKLENSGKTLAAYETELTDARKQLPAMKARITGFGMKELKPGRVVRPRMILVSEVNGQLYQLVVNLGEAKRSAPGRRVWRLIDVTSEDTQDDYEGSGDTHAEAIQAAVDAFRDNSEYGRGSLAVRLPDALDRLAGGKVILREPVMRVRPGSEARVFKRLASLATAAELAAMVVTGPLGSAIGIAGAVAGGAVAAHNLVRRAGAERLKADFQTAMDIVGVAGAFISVAGLGAGRLSKAGGSGGQVLEEGAQVTSMHKLAARATKVGEYLHIAGQGLMHGQWIILPMSAAHELAAIDAEEQADIQAGRTPDRWKYAAKRLEAWGRLVKGGVVQVRTMQMHGNPDVGWDPYRRDGKPAPHDAPAPPVDAPRPPTPGDAAPPRPGDVAPPAPPPREPAPAPAGKGAQPPGGAERPALRAPERPADASAPAAFKAAAERAVAGDRGPPPGSVRLVDGQLVKAMWDAARAKGTAPRGRPGETPVAIRDPDTGRLYVSREAFTASAEMQAAAFDAVMGHMNGAGKQALGAPLAAAFGELVFHGAVPGAPELSAGTPDARALADRVAHLAGMDAIERLLYRGDVKTFDARLAEALGPARARALGAALRGGDVPTARKLAAEADPALADAYGQKLSDALTDRLTRSLGGRATDRQSAALGERLSRAVGQDVTDAALFGGRVDELRAALEQRLGPAAAKRFTDAVRAGDVSSAMKALESARPGPAAPAPSPEPAAAKPKPVEVTPAPKPSPVKPVVTSDPALAAGLPPKLRDAVAAVRDPALGDSTTVRIHYELDALGLVSHVEIRAGSRAAASHIAEHVGTVELMLSYKGISGFARVLFERVRAAVFRSRRATPVGSKAWEARLEVEKLPRIIKARMEQLGAGGLDAPTTERLRSEVDYLEVQLERHRQTFDRLDTERGRGFVAAEGDVLAAAVREGYPALDKAPGHYYVLRPDGGYELVQRADSPHAPMELVNEGGRWGLREKQRAAAPPQANDLGISAAAYERARSALGTPQRLAEVAGWLRAARLEAATGLPDGLRQVAAAHERLAPLLGDPAAVAGLLRLTETTVPGRTHPMATDTILEVLLDVPAENLGPLLRLIGDPASPHPQASRRRLIDLGGDTETLQFVEQHGYEALETLSADRKLWQALRERLESEEFRNDPARRAAEIEALMEAGSTAARKRALGIKRAKPRRRLKLDEEVQDLLEGTPERSASTKTEWDEYLADARKVIVKERAQPLRRPLDDSAAPRTALARLLRIREHVQAAMEHPETAGRYQGLGYREKIAILDAMDRIGNDAGLPEQWTTNHRAAVAEALFAPGGGLRQQRLENPEHPAVPKRKKGAPEPVPGAPAGPPGKGYSRLDGKYGPNERVKGSGRTEHLELKSDKIDGYAGDGEVNAHAVATAEKYAGQGTQDWHALLANRSTRREGAVQDIFDPAVDGLVIHFVRKPVNEATQTAMLEHLFGPDSAFTAVRFGDGPWIERPRTKGGPPVPPRLAQGPTVGVPPAPAGVR